MQPDVSQSQPESHRYLVVDPETHGSYRVVSRTAKTQEELEQIIASVIQDEGRVQAGVIRTILI